MKKIIYTLCFLMSTQMIWAQTNWEHVGPKSDNQQNGNGFETSQMNNITIDPNDPLHLFASGWFGGLWEAREDRNGEYIWSPIDNTVTGLNGVSGVAFLGSTDEILVANFHPNPSPGFDDSGAHHYYSTGVWKYNFTTHVWQATGPITNPSGLPFGIRSVAVYPGNNSILFACTSIGLFRSTNGGGNWALISGAGEYVENIVFVPYGTGNYYAYISGSNLVGDYSLPTGTLMVKETSDATASTVVFNNLSSHFSTPAPYDYGSHSKICFKPVDGSGNVQLFLYTIGTNGDYNWTDPQGRRNMEYLHTFTKNINTGSITYPSNTNLLPSGNGTSGGWVGTPYRMGFDYDPVNNALWFGGTYLSYFNLTASSLIVGGKNDFHSSGGSVHYDIHDIQIKNSHIYIACDGGIVRSVLLPYSSISFSPLNNGLHVNLLNGFSGTDDDPNLYAIGGQDITNSDIYDAGTGKNRYTQPTWENDGAMIDKFNANNMFFDYSSYATQYWYYTSMNGGQTINSEGFYAPSSNPTTFEQGSPLAEQQEGWFTTHLFCQDPYRPNRVYYSKQLNGACQFDYVSNTFVLKIDPTTAQPNYNPVTGTGDFNIRGEKKQSIVGGFSFSPQTPNSMYITVGGFGNPAVPLPSGSALPSRPTIMKYIGNNLDDCWKGHNEAYYTDWSGTHPQWASITSTLWENLSSLPGCTSCNNLTSATNPWLYTLMGFKDIETSPWNKDVVYVAVFMWNNPGIQVLKYDGSNWSNYSNGIPNGEIAYSMVMDHQSNDALYLSTDKAVYYRDANSSQWTLHKTGLPAIQSRQIEINYKENTVRAGTFGRGIYKTDLKCPGTLPPINGCTNCNSPSNYYWEGTAVTVSNTTLNTNKQIIRAVDYIDILPETTFDPLGNTNVYYDLFIHGCSAPGNSYRSNNIADEVQTPEEEEEEAFSDMAVFPNPNNGTFTLSVKDSDLKNVYVYDLLGKVVYQRTETNEQQFHIDISDNPKGMYIVKVMDGDNIKTLKVINQ